MTTGLHTLGQHCNNSGMITTVQNTLCQHFNEGSKVTIRCLMLGLHGNHGYIVTTAYCILSQHYIGSGMVTIRFHIPDARGHLPNVGQGLTCHSWLVNTDPELIRGWHITVRKPISGQHCADVGKMSCMLH